MASESGFRLGGVWQVEECARVYARYLESCSAFAGSSLGPAGLPVSWAEWVGLGLRSYGYVETGSTAGVCGEDVAGSEARGFVIPGVIRKLEAASGVDSSAGGGLHDGGGSGGSGEDVCSPVNGGVPGVGCRGKHFERNHRKKQCRKAAKEVKSRSGWRSGDWRSPASLESSDGSSVSQGVGKCWTVKEETVAEKELREALEKKKPWRRSWRRVRRSWFSSV